MIQTRQLATIMITGIVGYTLISCHSQKRFSETSVVTHTSQQVFWQSILQLCGNSYEGAVVAAPANDTIFKNKTLVMNIRACNNDRIRIPFVVGNDFSRTWVFTKTKTDLLLKHDHRHKDGSPDSITQYGGHTTNSGSETMQFFPADQETISLLPAAGGNMWWIELIPGSYFTYNLRRMGTDRYFSIRFDLTKTIPAPDAPWGWKE